MNVVLDAYAVIALLRDEPAAVETSELLRRGADVEIHPLNLAEVLDRLCRLDDLDPDDVEADVAMLGIHVAPAVDVSLVAAGPLRSRHYRRTHCAVSLADCVAATHVLMAGAPLATSDPHLADVVRAEGGELIPLPDSQGRRPTAG